MRKQLPEDKKRKKLSISINPEVYELWKQYCLENGIENYSEYIEKLIKEKIKTPL
jgi:predicted CopG family antitoxin